MSTKNGVWLPFCEYYCAFANLGQVLHGQGAADHKIAPRIRIEERNNISFAVSCRHCTDPLCVKGCISGALTIVDGAVQIDSGKCVGCYTCILSFRSTAADSSNGAIQ